jgi:hypothetical protein
VIRIYIALRIISTSPGIISIKLPLNFKSSQMLSNASIYQPGRRRYYIDVCACRGRDDASRLAPF